MNEKEFQALLKQLRDEGQKVTPDLVSRLREEFGVPAPMTQTTERPSAAMRFFEQLREQNPRAPIREAVAATEDKFGSGTLVSPGDAGIPRPAPDTRDPTGSDFGTLLAHSATLSLAPQILDWLGQKEAAEKWQGRVGEARERQGAGALIPEIAGGLLLPAKMFGVLGGRIASPAHRAGIAAGAGGATMGLGESYGDSPMSRVGQTLFGGGVGYMTGATLVGLFGGARAGVRAMRRFGGHPGERLSRELGELTRAPREGYVGVNRALKAERTRISDELYKPLEAELEHVRHPAISEFLTSEDAAKYVRAAKIPVSRSKAILAGGDPSFTEVQAIRAAMKRDPVTKQAFNNVLAEIPDIKAADDAYFAVNEDLRMLDKGYKTSNPDMQTTLLDDARKLSPRHEQMARNGMIFNRLDKLKGLRQSGVVKLSGEWGVDRMRPLFVDDAAFADFMQRVGSSATAAEIRSVLTRYILWGAWPATTGFIIGRTGGIGG